jgi:modulator of FtsH protease HflK
MPWTNQGGTNEDGSQPPHGPWGKSQSGSGDTPPGLEAALRRGVDRLRAAVPALLFTRRSLALLGGAVLALWLLSGVYFVNAGSQCIVLRFGAVSTTTGPGMHYHLPWPVEVAYQSNIDKANWVNIGFQSEEDSSQPPSDVAEESHMLTADGNIVDVNFTVHWRIVDMPAYLFNMPHAQESTVKAVAESTMREVVGESQFERIQTVDRGPIQSRVRDMMQKVVDGYRLGILITGVRLLKTDFPSDVTGAGQVPEARADGDRARKSASTLVPEARGQAARMVQDAQAYRDKASIEADGEAKRFLSVLAEYRKAPDVTRKRIYLETMSQVLASANTVIVDDGVKGVVQLPQQKAAPPVTHPAAPQPAQAEPAGGFQ